MKIFVGMSIVLLAFGAVSVFAEDKVSTPLAQGLEAFEAPSENPWWTVKDGELVGRSDEKMKGSTLYTKETFGDFEAECSFNGKGFKDGPHGPALVNFDSGLFFRNRDKIQVQWGVSRSLKKDMTGSLYVAGGGYKYATQKPAGEFHKPGEWNTMKLRVQGDAVQVWMNGEQVLDAKIDGQKDPGPIGVQLHGGVDMEVQVKDLKIRPL